MIGCTSKLQTFKLNSSVVSEIESTDYLLKHIQTRQVNLTKLSSYLLELESQLSLIFATSPDIIVLLDKDSNILKISDAVFSILEYKRQDLLGKSLWDFISVADLDKTKFHLKNLKNKRIQNLGGNTPLVNHWISKSGKLVKLIWRFSIYDERDSQIVGIASDVSTFTNDENHCAKVLQRAVNLSTDGIAVTDSHSKGNEIVYVNKAFAEITGYSQQELLGKNCKFLQTEECTNSRAIKTLKESIKTGKGCDILLQNVRKNGEVFYNKLSVSAVKQGGEALNHIWISKDVTEEIGVKYEWSPNTERGFYVITS